MQYLCRDVILFRAAANDHEHARAQLSTVVLEILTYGAFLSIAL